MNRTKLTVVHRDGSAFLITFRVKNLIGAWSTNGQKVTTELVVHVCHCLCTVGEKWDRIGPDNPSYDKILMSMAMTPTKA